MVRGRTTAPVWTALRFPDRDQALEKILDLTMLTELRLRDGRKASYVAPWDETPEGERESAAAVYNQMRAFIGATDGGTVKLARSQKGRFVALCWIGQIFKYFPDPKPAYVANWGDLPKWQQKTDADIFERIEQDV